jgi:hypothetical protein
LSVTRADLISSRKAFATLRRLSVGESARLFLAALGGLMRRRLRRQHPAKHVVL